MRYPLVDGQGNFGSIDGDNPAAMRYTEVRLTKLAEEMLRDDIDKETVDWVPNYDGSRARAAGAAGAGSRTCWSTAARGIAVGMATNIPPHNLGEVVDALDAADRQPGRRRSSELMRGAARPRLPDRRLHPRPRRASAPAYATGRGIIQMRAARRDRDPATRRARRRSSSPRSPTRSTRRG